MPREKSRYRDKRSSSTSSESSYDRRKSKSKHKRRSRSRDRSESSSRRRKRSSSRSKHRRRSYSRSVSRDRYESRSRRRSSSRSRSKRSKHSRDRSHSRSHSKSRFNYNKSKQKSKKRSRSSSRSSSFDIEPRKLTLDDTDTKIEKAIKAAEAAGLTMTKIPTYDYKQVDVKEDMPTIHDRNLLAELNSDSFVQKSFTSSRNKKQSQNIVIDLNADTIKLPESEVKTKNDDSILNFDEIPSMEERKEMWIKKLYQYRKKMLREEIQ